jgi:hypothetical protein
MSHSISSSSTSSSSSPVLCVFALLMLIRMLTHKHTFSLSLSHHYIKVFGGGFYSAYASVNVSDCDVFGNTATVWKYTHII